MDVAERCIFQRVQGCDGSRRGHVSGRIERLSSAAYRLRYTRTKWIRYLARAVREPEDSDRTSVGHAKLDRRDRVSRHRPSEGDI